MESGWAMGNIMERMRSMGTGAVGATGSFMVEGPTCLFVQYHALLITASSELCVSSVHPQHLPSRKTTRI